MEFEIAKSTGPVAHTQGVILLPPPHTRLLEAPNRIVSDNEFDDIVRGALSAVGGKLLFKIVIDVDGKPHHAAAASVGEGELRQFLLLTLPVHGGHLQVETTTRSSSPLAGIAASYAGLLDVLKAAA